MAPKKQAPGPRTRRVVRATAKPVVPVPNPNPNPNPSSDPLAVVKSPNNGKTKTKAKPAPKAAILPISSPPPIETETSSAKSSVVISAETVEESVVEEKRQNYATEMQNGKISAGKETLAQENGNREVTLGIGTDIVEKDSIGGSGKGNGDSGNENVVEMKPKKKTKKVVKVVKKIVKKRVPKSLLKGVASYSNKELTTEEEVLDDGGVKISSGDTISPTMQEVGMINLSEASEDKGLEKQPEILIGEPTIPEQEVGKAEPTIPEHEVGKAEPEIPEHEVGKVEPEIPEQEVGNVDSSISASIDVDNTDVGVTLSVEEAENPDQPVSVSMEVEKLKTMGQEGEEVCVSEIPVEGEKNDGVVEKSDSAIVMPIEVVNVDFAGDRNNEFAESSRGYEGWKEEVEKGDDSVTGKGDDNVMDNGRIVLSGELEALERRRKRKTEIFIGGLNTDAKEEDVRKVFEEVGDVVEVRLVINSKTGKNKGYAFVRYASAADAKKALDKYAKVEICGKQCATAPVEGNDTLFLGNIDKKWTNEDVIKLLQEIGIEKIDKVTVMTDPSNVGRNRGFAFLELETNKDAQTALKKLQKKDSGKLQNIKVSWAEPLSEPDEEELLKVKSVYAEYLPSSWDEEKVRSYFTKFGEIENVVLSRNLHSSRRKDFAFINYKIREAALACIESFKHGMLGYEGSQVHVKVSLAKPMPKGKPHKKVYKSTNKEISKQKQVTRCTVKPIEPKVKETPATHINNQRTGDIRSPGTSELEKLLAERALRKQMQSRLGTGTANVDYSQFSPGQKRSFSALGDDLNYSDPRGYSCVRVESYFPAGRPSYGDVSPGVGMAPPSYYQQRGPDYPLGHRYSDANSFQREDAPYRGIGRDYYRY